MNGIVKDIGLGILRNVATASGGWLVANHYMQSGQVNDFMGSVLFLGGLAFTVVDKFAAQKKVAVALATAVPATVATGA